MEHEDDPEKRIAELGRRESRPSAGRPVEQPPAYPPAPQPGWGQQAPNPYPAQPQPGWQQTPGWQRQPQHWQPPIGQSGDGLPPSLAATSSFQKRRIERIVMAVVAGVLVAAGIYGYELYAYAVGTPATATGIHCSGGDFKNFGGNGKCSKGKQQCAASWEINGATRGGVIKGTPDPGSTVEVRVHDGTAYTLGSAGWGLALTAIGAVVAPLSLFWLARNRRRLA